MKRADKYKDTSVFHFYNANPHGRYGDDCVVRAIATALKQSWEQTLTELTEVGLKYGYLPNDSKCFERYLKNKGWIKQGQPKKTDGTKYTGAEFCRYRKEGRIIANIGSHHIVAIIDGKVNDIWDCTDRCIGCFWIKE